MVALYVDQTFPPDGSSLWGKGSSQQWCYEILEWLRPHQLSPTPIGLFNADAAPLTNTVRQGFLPDCYLVSAIALLAQQPHLVRRLFTAYDAEEGICTCKLFCDGRWQSITMDTLLPCTEKRPAFAHHSNGEELFACFLEKACAKLYGCYGCLDGGRIDEALFMFTAAPTIEMRFPKMEQVLSELQAEGDPNLLACVSTSTELRGDLNDPTEKPRSSRDNRCAPQLRHNHVYVICPKSGVLNLTIGIVDPGASRHSQAEERECCGEMLEMNLQDFLQTFDRLFVCLVGSFAERSRLPRRSFDLVVTSKNSGGASSFPTFPDNPMFRIRPSCQMRMAVTVSQPDSRRCKHLPLPQLGITLLRQEVLRDVATDAKSCTRNRRRILHQTPFESKRDSSLVFDVGCLASSWEYRIVPSHFYPGDRGFGRLHVHFTWSGPDDAVIIEEIAACTGLDVAFAGKLVPTKAGIFADCPSFRVRAPSVPVPITVTMVRNVEATLCWWKQDPFHSVLHDLFELYDADADGLLSRQELVLLSEGLLQAEPDQCCDSNIKLMFEERCDCMKLDFISFGQMLSQNLWCGLATKTQMERNAQRLCGSHDIRMDISESRPESNSFAAVAALNCAAPSFIDAAASLAPGCPELPLMSDAAVWSTSYMVQQAEFFLCPVLRGNRDCSFELSVRSPCTELVVEEVGGTSAAACKRTRSLHGSLLSDV